MTATGKLNTESELLALLCKCVLMGFSMRCYYLSQGVVHCTPVMLLILHFFPLFLPPGQIQEVSLSQDEPAPQVEVTPELDLEVVPESSGHWHNVFP